MTEKENIELNKIATRINYTLRERGDLETQNIDDKDFINIPVWEIKEMLKQAYSLGKQQNNKTLPNTGNEILKEQIIEFLQMIESDYRHTDKSSVLASVQKNYIADLKEIIEVNE